MPDTYILNLVSPAAQTNELHYQLARDNYQLAQADGYLGTREEWLLTQIGPQGDQGVQGEQGIQGEQGDQGPQGNAGDVGQPAGLYYLRAGDDTIPAPGLFCVDVMPTPTVLRVNKTSSAFDDYTAYLAAIAIGDHLSITAQFVGSASPLLATVQSISDEGAYMQYGLADASGLLPDVGQPSGMTVYAKGAQGVQGVQGVQGETGEIPTLDVSTQSGTTHTLALADIQTLIHYTNVSGCAVTITTDAVGGWSTNAEIAGLRGTAAGALTLLFPGVTVIGGANIARVGQGEPFGLKRIAANTWAFF